jgi:hypothetical protein
VSSRRSTFATFIVALLAIAACSRDQGASSPGHEGQKPRARRTLSEKAVQKVLASVPVARQLPQKRPIRIDRLSEDEFRRLLRDEHLPPAASGGLSPKEATLLGFNFVPPPEERARTATAREVLEEEIAGFYDREADRIVVPLVPLENKRHELEQRAVLAHEIQHALQAQHFPPPPKPESDDAAIAQLALWEGDAVVAMGAYIGADQGAPIGRTLRTIADVTREVRRDRLTHGKKGSAIDRSLPLFREELEFPYAEGMLFVADLYRAGGFPLVNQAFQSPPTATMHVLHPHKYLAGEEPRPFAQATPPNGHRAIASSVLGELRTRVLLAGCLDPARAESAASGWAGDRFTVVADDKRQLSVGWATSWDSVAEAEQFEEAVRAATRCFSSNRLGAKDDYAISNDLVVSRKDDVVVVLRGSVAKSAPAWQSALLSSARPKPPNEPRSSAVIPPREKLPPPRPGRLDGDVYWNTWLGVVGRVPPGMEAEVDEEFGLTVRREDKGTVGTLTISTRVSSQEQDDKTFDEALEGLEALLERYDLAATIEVESSREVKTALGSGVERIWRVSGTPLELRMVLVPICLGNGSIVVLQLYRDARGRRVLDGWLDSFRFTNGRAVEACLFLDPK